MNWNSSNHFFIILISRLHCRESKKNCFYKHIFYFAHILFNVCIFTKSLTLNKILVKELISMHEIMNMQFVARKDLYDLGLTPYKINKLVAEGKLKVINRNYFENLEYNGEVNAFSAVSAFAPKGVVCLISAAIYHELSSARPLQIDVALPRKTRIPKSSEQADIKYYLFTDERYSIGIETVVDDNNQFKIYDKEKTVCDILFYRNKLGFEPAIEVLRNYINSSDRDINKLMEYAEKLRCAKLLREYLEVMI